MKNLFLIALALAAACGRAAEWDLGRDGVELKVSAAPDAVDLARDFFVTVTMTADAGVALPDLRDRFRGFQVAEDFAEEPLKNADGRVRTVSKWRLVPEPCAEKYSLRPFVVADESGSTSFYTAPIAFAPPAAREPVTGAMEVDPKKDLPPLSWTLVGWIALALAAAAALAWLVWLAAKKLREMVRVHKMSPIQRAYWELDKLLRRGLPGRGQYKDFYVELTMVVRRYVQRQHGVHAPNLTTEEFFDATRNAPSFPKSTLDLLITFLRRADMVKFAGVTATIETADAAVESARAYVSKDDEIVSRKLRTANRKH